MRCEDFSLAESSLPLLRCGAEEFMKSQSIVEESKAITTWSENFYVQRMPMIYHKQSHAGWWVIFEK